MVCSVCDLPRVVATRYDGFSPWFLRHASRSIYALRMHVGWVNVLGALL
jgi:hypothetical protein